MRGLIDWITSYWNVTIVEFFVVMWLLEHVVQLVWFAFKHWKNKNRG